MIDQKFWQGKRVFLTGHTGFKGSWLSLWLSSLGVEVKGYALNPPTSPSLFNEAKVSSIIDSQIGDIRDQDTLHESMTKFSPDILIHMAAQPLVRYSYEAPIETYEVNVIGTAKVLEVARSCPNLKAIVNITTDKCYENDERSEGYKEDDPMGGYDPYSSSKGCAELVASAYRRSFLQDQGIGLASVRAGNVIGGGDWADDRLIPDILRSFEKNEPVVIRNPKATRPWQHVLEPVAGYMILAQKLFENKTGVDEAWNFGPDDNSCQPVRKVVEIMANQLGLTIELPTRNSVDAPHETHLLKLNSAKARSRLGWHPVLSLEEALDQTCNWYDACYRGQDMHDVSCEQILAYQRAAIDQA